MSSGLFPFPHRGDWMHAGHPASHGQASISSRVFVSSIVQLGERALGQAGASRNAVVEKDRRTVQLGVRGVRDASDVAAIGDGEEGEQADHRVLGGVDPPMKWSPSRREERGKARGISIHRPVVS